MTSNLIHFEKISRKPPAKWPARYARSANLIIGVALALLTPLSTLAESPVLADLTIEELMNEPVTSVGKKETSLDRSPAAITVVTGDDVRRLGLTSIPEALRLVPGLDVARINASQWAISSRGFNQQYSNKLLVLMDGRSVYTPVNVSATLVADTVRKSKVGNLGRVVDLLEQHSTDLAAFVTTDSQGKNLTGFLGQLHQRLGTEQSTLLLEVESAELRAHSK